MTVSSIGASASAYYYLQSLLPPRPADGGEASGDPVTELLNAFYPSGTGAQSGSAPDPASGTSFGAAGPAFSPDTMTSLMSLQEQPPGVNPFVSARPQALFSQIDANGDGQISQSEFENIFGSNADLSKVDGLFKALDGDGDGSVSQDELTSAMQASHARHHHHHHANPSQGAGDLLQALMTTGTQGATATTASGSDGSSTTTIKYADGSSMSLTTPPASTLSAATDSGSTDSSSTDSGSSGTGSNSSSYFNLLEQLIRLQAQSLSAMASQNQATSQTLLSA